MRANQHDTRTVRSGAAQPTPVSRLEQAIRSWPSPEAHEWTRRMVQTACANPSVLAVVAIGSAVRMVNASDDVDFLLIYASDEPPAFGLQPLDVDVLQYAAPTVDDKLALGHDLLGWATQFGVLLFERDGYWSGLTHRWISCIPLPSADQALERAARARRLTEDLRIVGDLESAAEQYISWLTHEARARLIRSGVYPASRPELAGQLRQIGAYAEADELDAALADRLRASTI